MNRRAFSPPFFIVCAAIILVCTAALMFTKGEKAKTALVYKDNTLLKTLSLNEDTRFDINGKYKLTITVKNGEIFVSESNCPCKTCKNFGKLSKEGQTAVCLPSNVRIELLGSSEYDAVL